MAVGNVNFVAPSHQAQQGRPGGVAFHRVRPAEGNICDSSLLGRLGPHQPDLRPCTAPHRPIL
jgi:hypothetical protein